MEQTQPARASLRCALVAAALLVLAAWPVGSAHALTFTGPTNFAAGNFPQWVAAGNFNGDTDPDLVVVDQHPNVNGAGSLSILLGAAGGTFSAPANINLGTTNPLSVSIGEFNGDTDPDLAVANEGAHDGTDPGKISILLGAAAGTFTAPTHYPAGDRPQEVAIGDFNGDLDPDLAAVNETPGGPNGTVSILLGASGSTFSAPTNFNVGHTPRGIAMGDFNGDSDPDLATANEISNNVSVLLGGAGGTFTGPTNINLCGDPTAIKVGQFNGDSDPDLAVASNFSQDVVVLLGAAGAGFTAPTRFVAGNLPGSIAVGKFDGDSHDDLAISNQGSDNVSILIRTVDTTPPETNIDAGPSALINDSTPTFTFSSNEAVSTFKCRVDSGAFASCSSPHTTAIVSDGAHTFQVRATDDAANTDATAAVWSFTVDTAAPSAPVLTGAIPNSPANDNFPKVKGTAEADSTVRLYRAGTVADCTPANLVATNTAAVLASPGISLVLADNSITTLRATATDQAGNTSGCSNSVTYVEVSPPVIVEPPSSGPGPGGGTPGGAGPPAGGGTVPGQSAPAIALAGKAMKMQSSGVVAVLLSCPASGPKGCEGTLSLEVLTGRTQPKRKVTLGKSSFQIAGARSAFVKIRLSKKKARLVRKLKRLPVYVVVKARDQAGNLQTTRRALTLRAAKPL